jgi:signal peptidase II
VTENPAAQAVPREATPVALRSKVVAGLIVVVGAALDLWSKSYMQTWLEMDPDHVDRSRFVSVIPGYFAWAGNWNTGVTFGLAQGQTWPILIFTVVACLGLAGWIALSRSKSMLLHVALGLVLAGALGNLYDRVQWHKVRDFVLLYWKDPSVSWPAFNLADSMIVVGVILILFRELFGPREPARAATTS